MALMPLSKSDPSRLHPDAFDVRSWEVRTEVDDDKVGTVHDVLIDGSGTPHLLDVNLGTLRRHVLVPLSQAWADASRKVVWVEGLAKDDFKKMPEYAQQPDQLTADFERRLADDFSAAAAGAHRAEQRPTRHRLARLAKNGDFRISKGNSDPRSWKVVGGDGAKLGKVTELIVDQDEMKVRYIDVDVDEGKLQLETVDRHVLVPIERARLDHKHKTVVLDGLFGRDLKDYPVFTGLPLGKGMEEEIEGHYRAPERSGEAWVNRSAQRFFGGGRRRPRDDDRQSDGSLAAAEAHSKQETVVRPREGEEVRIRVSRGEIIVEKHPGDPDHG